MKELTGNLLKYYQQEHKAVFLLSTIFIAGLITFNYTSGLNNSFVQYNFLFRTVSYFFLFSFAFTIPYLIQFLIKDTHVPQPLVFILMVIGSTLLFALKISFNGFSFLSNYFNQPWDSYITIVAKWPWKFLVVVSGILILSTLLSTKSALPGLSDRNFKWKPYLLLLSFALPLIVFAASQDDFLDTYPKVKTIEFVAQHTNSPLYSILFELAYGLDFFTIELFFRGFLVLCFIQFVGKDAILPMAVFYCTIHFGKPLGECITSYFGGILLGIITYHTRSIYGGLVVHLGIAWMMELVSSIAGG